MDLVLASVDAEAARQVVSAFVLVSMVVVIAVSAWVAWDFSRLRVTKVENDNEDAIRHFLTVLGQAEHELLIHDDGDDTEGTLYNDGGTVQAVRDRLRTCPDLKIRCLLNFKDDVSMARLSEEYGCRFQVRYLHQRPDKDVHFKIADGGKMAYLSTHEKGVVERRGQIIEDMGASAYVRKRRLGGFIEAFNEGFSKAHSA